MTKQTKNSNMENNTNNDQGKCPVNHGQTPATDGTTASGNSTAGKCPVMHGSIPQTKQQ
jgi:hypothetical protein